MTVWATFARLTIGATRLRCSQQEYAITLSWLDAWEAFRAWALGLDSGSPPGCHSEFHPHDSDLRTQLWHWGPDSSHLTEKRTLVTDHVLQL